MTRWTKTLACSGRLKSRSAIWTLSSGAGAAAAAQKIARRRAVLAVMACLPWALVATIVLWGLRPMVEIVGATLGELEPSLELVGFGAAALGLAFWLVRRFSPA